MLVALKSAGHG